MVLINAISCVSDCVSDCLHKVKVVHKGGMGNEARLASYLYHSEGGIHGSTTPCNMYIAQGIRWIVHCTFTKKGFVIEIAHLMWSSLVMSHHANLQQLHHITQATLVNWIVTSQHPSRYDLSPSWPFYYYECYLSSTVKSGWPYMSAGNNSKAITVEIKRAGQRVICII
jgi:hypothetical protein